LWLLVADDNYQQTLGVDGEIIIKVRPIVARVQRHLV
jgi:hypothetical protein